MKLVQEVPNMNYSLLKMLREKMFLSTHNEVWEWDRIQSRLIQTFKTNYSTTLLFQFLINVEDKFVFVDNDSWLLSNFDNANVFIFDKKGNLFDKKVLKNRYNYLLFDREHIAVYDKSNVLFRYDVINDCFISQISTSGAIVYVFNDYFLLVKNKTILELHNNKTDKKHWTIDLSFYLRQATNGDEEQIRYDVINYHVRTKQLLIRTNFGFVIAINPETGQINWAKPMLYNWIYIDPHSDNLYITQPLAFKRSDTREYKTKIHTCSLITGEDVMFFKEYTPEIIGLKGKDHASLVNIGFLSIFAATEKLLFFMIDNLGLIFQMDKTTGDIIDKYSIKNTIGLLSFVHDDHLFISTGKKGKNPHSLLVFDTSLLES